MRLASVSRVAVSLGSTALANLVGRPPRTWFGPTNAPGIIRGMSWSGNALASVAMRQG